MRRTLLVPLVVALSGCTSHLENLHANEPAGRALDQARPTRPDGARPWPTAMHDDVPDRRDAGASERNPDAGVAPSSTAPATNGTDATTSPPPGPRRESDEAFVEEQEDDLPHTNASAMGALGNPQLRALIADALASNRDVRAATARVFQAWALSDQARSRLLPQVSVQAIPSIGQSISPGIGGVFSRSFSATVPVSYEVDVAGRLWLETKATREEAEAAEIDVAGLDVAIAAQVTDAWLELVFLNVQNAQLARQLETNERVLELVDARFRSGIAGETDVLQQRQQVAATRTRIAQLVGLDRMSYALLAVLLGRSPEGYSVDVPSEFPDLAELPEGGIAVASIEQRPDVRATLRRLRAADDRFLIAARQNLPTLVLAATPGWQIVHSERGATPVSPKFSGTTSGPIWAVSATLSAPIFAGLRNVALRGQRRAQVDELVATYERTVISALSEVESALAQEAQQRALLISIEGQRANAAELRESAEAQYRAGITDFLTVFVAVQQEQTAELALVAAQRDLYGARVQLIRALGGNATGPTPRIR